MGSASAVNSNKPALNNDFFTAVMGDNRATNIEEITFTALFIWKSPDSNLIKSLLIINLLKLLTYFRIIRFATNATNQQSIHSSRSVFSFPICTAKLAVLFSGYGRFGCGFPVFRPFRTDKGLNAQLVPGTGSKILDCNNLEDLTMASAILDRLMRCCTMLGFEGKSYRLKEAAERLAVNVEAS